MKNILLFVFLLFFIACKNKNKDFFHTNDFIQAQVLDVEKAIYVIEKITTENDQSDTVAVKREDFRTLAKDFLSLPDLTTMKYSGKYKEEKFFQQEVNQIVFTYLPLKAQSGILQEDIIIKPQAGNDLVKMIYVNYIEPHKDSTVQKRLLWESNKCFQITTIVDMPQKTPQVKTMKVCWQ